jgi:hypothetical protein
MQHLIPISNYSGAKKPQAIGASGYLLFSVCAAASVLPAFIRPRWRVVAEMRPVKIGELGLEELKPRRGYFVIRNPLRDTTLRQAGQLNGRLPPTYRLDDFPRLHEASIAGYTLL